MLRHVHIERIVEVVGFHTSRLGLGLGPGEGRGVVANEAQSSLVVGPCGNGFCLCFC